MAKVKIQEVSSPGCVHCEKARKLLQREIKNKFPEVEIENIDMFSNEGMKLIQRHGIMFSPGVIINGELFSTGEVDRDKLIEKIKSLGS